MQKLVLVVSLGCIVYGQNLGYMLETSLLTCTDFSIKAADSPYTKINDVESCLLQGNVLKIPETNVLLNATLKYHYEVQQYESLAAKVSHHDMENRREVRSLQQELVTLLMRLKYFSSAFNVPNFARLSDGRRLMTIKIHARNLRDTSQFVGTVHPIMESYVSKLRNLTSLLPLLDIQEQRRASSKVEMEEAVEDFRNLIRAQYVS